MNPYVEIIRTFLANLHRTQFMAPEKIQTYQRGLLDLVVRHARAHVPFYRDTGRLDPLFLDDDSIDWDRWPELPILTRQEVQQNVSALTSDFLPPEHGATFEKKSSGSTGEPVCVTHSELAGSYAWTAMLLRDYERHGIDISRRLVHIGPFSHDDFDLSGTRFQSCWEPPMKMLGFPGERYDLASTRPADDLVEAVAALAPDYLRLLPINLEMMMAHDRRRLLSKLRLKGLISFGEYLDPDLKIEFQTDLGCRIMERYGCVECGNLATTCADCGRYHVAAEMIDLEIVDDEGRAVAPGEAGRVIATPFYNYAMPLIRYAVGDIARRGEPGGCRISLPSIDQILGRQATPFVFAGNVAIRPMLPVKEVVRYLGARRFMVAQVADDRCEVRIVPGSLTPGNMQFDRLTELMKSLWWAGLKVDYKIVESLPELGLKPRHFIREMPAAVR